MDPLSLVFRCGKAVGIGELEIGGGLKGRISQQGYDEFCAGQYTSIEAAVEAGCLPSVMYLAGTAKPDYEEAFVVACKHGHLATAQWLKREWPDINPNARGAEAFRWVCANGHLLLAHWLMQEWPAIDPRVFPISYRR